jgi:hypothetical protein
LHARIGIQQTHAVGSDQTAPGIPNPRQQLGLASRAIRPGLGETCADHADPANTFRDAVIDNGQYFVGGYDDDREIDLAGYR